MKKAAIVVCGVLLTAIIATGFVLGGQGFGQYGEDAPARNEPSRPEADLTVSIDADSSDGVSVIEAKVSPYAYPSITVEVNKPVRINFRADAADLNPCNDVILIPEWGIELPLSAGDNFVEFTPTKTGTFGYSCWMGMIQGSITVVPQGSGDAGALPPDPSANTRSGCGMASGGCCGGGR